jgi:hypothetical protein
MRTGDHAAAARHQRAAQRIVLQLGDTYLAASGVVIAARLAAARGDWGNALRLQWGADVALDKLGAQLYSSDRALSDDVISRAREVLPDAAVDAARAASASIDLIDLCAEADTEFERWS